MILNPEILIRLILSHLIFDFLFQPDKWVTDKNEKGIRSVYLYIHCLMQSAGAYVFAGDWGNIYLPLIIFATHFIIDTYKIYSGKNVFEFILDQILHIAVIFFIWIYFYSNNILLLDLLKIYSGKVFLITAGVFIIIFPLPVMINIMMKRWEPEIKDRPGLEDAGKWIGILERTLAFIFIIIGQYAGIGFLIAAKSIFRFSDIKDGNDRKLTEYFLIGSLISYTSVMITGGMIKYLLKFL